MKHRRFLIPAAIALAAALLLTACGQPAGNTDPSPARIPPKADPTRSPPSPSLTADPPNTRRYTLTRVR